jgi:hypothetical protein
MTPAQPRHMARRSLGDTLNRTWRKMRRRRLRARIERMSMGDHLRYARARWARRSQSGGTGTS